MRSSRRPGRPTAGYLTVAVLVGSLLAGLLATAVPGSAQAGSRSSPAGTIRRTTLPASLSIGTSHVRSFTLTADVTTAHPTTARITWTLQRNSGACFYFATGRFARATGTTWRATGSLRAADLGSNDCAGPAILDVLALTDEGDDSTSAVISLTRAARLDGMDAMPEPVPAGGTVTVRATLQRADWFDRDYHPYLGRTARLQFRPAGSTAYGAIQSVTSSGGGVFAATVRQSQSGCWRYVFAGSTTTSPTVGPADCVQAG